MHEGTLDGSRVCVKRVRIYTQDTNRSAKVCYYAVASLPAITNRVRRPSAKRP